MTDAEDLTPEEVARHGADMRRLSVAEKLRMLRVGKLSIDFAEAIAPPGGALAEAIRIYREETK